MSPRGPSTIRRTVTTAAIAAFTLLAAITTVTAAPVEPRAPVRGRSDRARATCEAAAVGGDAEPAIDPAFEPAIDPAFDPAFDLAIDPAIVRPIEPAIAPPIAEVIEAARAAAGLDRDAGRGLARRARLAGLVPRLGVRTGRTTSWRDGEPDVGRGTVVEVRATWRLDRLVFDPRELQVAALAAARRRERAILATRVIRSYFRWQRARRHGRSLDVAATVADLDGLTDGWFSTALRRTASEPRTLRGAAATP